MLLATLIFLTGLIIGSFINAFLWRYENGIGMSGRSMCPNCRKTIHWYDNIPVVSYLFLTGKCRNCKKKISIQYPIVELLTAMSFLTVGLFSSSGRHLSHILDTFIANGSIVETAYFLRGILEVLLLCVISAILIIIAIHDYRTKEISNGFNLTFIIIASLYLFASQWGTPNFIQAIITHIVSAFFAFIFFFSFVYFSKETWMGGGDAKMAIGIGLLLGPLNTFLAITIASITGSIYGLTALAITSKDRDKKEKSKKHEVPFGPFLALGTYIAMVFGQQIISWYVRIFLGIS